ncbi:hypothetical protein RB594_004464 [Gaeumannomyces avenae]
MFGIRICPSCGIRIRASFGRQCNDCDTRQRDEERLTRRVRFEDDPVVVRRSRSPCRLRIRRSSPRREDETTTMVRRSSEYDVVNVGPDDFDDDFFSSRPPANNTTVTRYYTTTRPSSRDRARDAADHDYERARLREARDRGVNENGTRWSRSLRDFERERLDRYGGREYDREVDWEIRRSRPSRRDRDIFDVCYEL